MLLVFNICAKHVLVWRFLSFFPPFPTSSPGCPPPPPFYPPAALRPIEGVCKSRQCRAAPRELGPLGWPCHLVAPGIALPAWLLAGAGCGRQGWSFWSEIRGGEGSFTSVPLPAGVVNLYRYLQQSKSAFTWHRWLTLEALCQCEWSLSWPRVRGHSRPWKRSSSLPRRNEKGTLPLFGVMAHSPSLMGWMGLHRR